MSDDLIDNSDSYKNEVEGDLEDGELIDEDDATEMNVSTKQNPETKAAVYKVENSVRENARDKYFEPQWNLKRQPPQQTRPTMMIQRPDNRFERFNDNNDSRDETVLGNKRKQHFGYQMNDDRHKRRRYYFNRTNENNLMFGNYHNNTGTFDRRTICNETQTGPSVVNGCNDDEGFSYYVRGRESQNNNINVSMEIYSQPTIENYIYIPENNNNKIPSLLEMNIPVPEKIKNIEKSQNEIPETINKNIILMSSPSQGEFKLDNTFEPNKNEFVPNKLIKNHSSHKNKKFSRQQPRQEGEIMKRELEERRKQIILEKIIEQKQLQLAKYSNTHNDWSDDDDDDDQFNDLVIDEEKFENNEKDKKLDENPIQSQIQQRFINSSSFKDDVNNATIQLGKSDVDLRPQSFKRPYEIDASLYSHPPIKYKLLLAEVSVTDYSNIQPMIGIDDPRLRRNITADKNQQIKTNRDPRTHKQQNNTSKPNYAPQEPTQQPHIMDVDMRMKHRLPQIPCAQNMAVAKILRKKQ